MSSSHKGHGRVGFISLGCPKALVDSEHILSQLRAEGYDVVQHYDEADVVVINTCGFIEDAVQESLDAIDEAMAEHGKVIVTGCLGARGNIVREQFPDVLAVTGPHALQEVVDAVHTHLPRPHDPRLELLPAGGIKLTPRHYAYLKISEGCNHRCSFCIIPALRGDLVSRDVGEVLQEAENLVRAGVKELLVISQDTSAYGVDVKYKTGFWHGRPVKTRMTELAAALGELGAWVRLHYVYPYPHVDALMPLMAEGKILPYLDIPFQHASPSILKAMRRPANAENVLSRISQWRATVPDLTLRSTFIVGFPGETEDDFRQLLDFLDEAQLDRVGAFAYSPVEGAKANDLPNPVPEVVKQERLQQFMEKQAAISAAKLEARVGQTLTVIIDGYSDEGLLLARSNADAPEVDGVVILDDVEDEVEPGQFMEVTVTGATEHDLIARQVRQVDQAHSPACPPG